MLKQLSAALNRALNRERPTVGELKTEMAAPSHVGVRQPWHPSAADNLTPARLAQILASAARGHARDYLTLAEEMEERDLHYASVLGTRKLALVGLDVRVEAVTDKPEDVRRADAVRELATSAEFGELVSHLVDALGKGYAVSEMIWDRSGREWMPRFVERDARFFTWDQETGRELRLLDEADPARGIPLPPYKFIVHTPKLRSGLPVRGGLARLAAVAYMCKAWTWRDWMAFADIYGLPMRVGTYGPGASPADISALMAAVANLGSDAAAVIHESTRITFEQAAQTAGAGAFFDKLAAFWDKQVSKGVLGQTMTADDGASLSQAEVHQLVRLDIMTADARALSNTLQRQLVRPFCDLNFGPGDTPLLTIVVPKPENIAALVESLSKLVPLGLEVEQSVIRDKLGLPDPDPGAVLLKAPAPPPAPGVPADGEGAPEGAGTIAAAGDVQTAALNGAQVKALQDILGSAARGEVPIATAEAMIAGAFPLLTAEQIGKMIKPLQGFQPPAHERAANAELPTPAPVPTGDAVTLGAELMARRAAPIIDLWMDEVRALLESAGSLEAFGDRLIDLLVRLPKTGLARELAQALATLTLAGRAEVADQVAQADAPATALNAEQEGGGLINRGWQPAAEYFMQKVNLPTQRWDDLWQGQHARAFVVAGATQEALLADLRRAVEDAVVHGGSYEAFKADFEDIVARHGWTGWTGEGSEAGRDWRARTIWQTNMATAHAAGRYQQMTDPDTLAHMPYWQYRHNSVTNPREEHLRWDGLVLHHEDPWWKTHYPPNGWNCRCDVRPVSERMLRRLRESGQPDSAPPPGEGDPPPEWAYNVGEAAWGKPVAEKIIQTERGGKMVSLDTRGPADFGRPAALPLDEPRAPLAPRITDPAQLRDTFRQAVGGESAILADPTGTRIHVTDAIVDHWLEDLKRLQGREQYLPLLPELVEQPYEIWAGFARNELTGKVELRRRYVKAVNVGKSRVIGLVADAVAGEWVSFNLFSGGLSGANNLRTGLLVWGRP